MQKKFCMKLVLFDIDGTLICHTDKIKQAGFPRFMYAVKQAYGIDITFTTGYNGWVDKQIIRSVVPEHLFSKIEFDKQWPKAKDALYSYAKHQESDGTKLYGSVEDAVNLARVLHNDSRYTLGVLTGNIEKMAHWKLHHAGVPNFFPFGVYSDAFDDRISLTKSIFEKVKKEFNINIQGDDITIIGDSIYDVRCGKAIGAKTIAVSTGILTGKGGIHGGKSDYKMSLEQENPDLLVDSLMDTKVLDFFHLKP